MSRSASVSTIRSFAIHRPLGLVGGLAVFAAVATSSACLNFAPFSCRDDSQCDAQAMGRCQAAAGYCSYPDPTCPESGLRFDADAGDGLGDQCVVPGMGTGTGTSEPPATPTTASSLGTDATPPGTTTIAPTDDTSGGSTTVGEACGGGGQACCPDGTCDDGLSCFEDRCGCVSVVAAGDRHSCAIKLDGSVWCWGANDRGQLAADAPESFFEPRPIAGFGPDAPATQLRARAHTCAQRADASLTCWGDNTGLKVDIEAIDLDVITTPVDASWIESAQRFAVGGTHTCVAQGPGAAVVCWGDNGSGQLTGAEAPGPVLIEGFDPSGIAMGVAHTCMNTTDGALLCWGQNADGQIATDPALMPTVTTASVVPVEGVEQVVSGDAHVCARTETDVWCWGRNNRGQVGDGTQVSTFVPTLVSFPNDAGPVATLTAASDQTCALTDDGAMYCWGGNQRGELLLPAIDAEDGFSTSPVASRVDIPLAQLSTGGEHTCALSTDGQVWCWGENGQGQVGDGTTIDGMQPTAVALSCP